MTIPTQAQIEADIFKAAEAANKEFGQWMPQRWVHLFVRAYVALTAAAEVGEPTHLVSEIHRQHKEIERLRGVNGDLRAEIGRGFEPCHQCQRWVKVTAAAAAEGEPNDGWAKDVRKPSATTKLYRLFREMWLDAEKEIATIEAATIERCAQVAEQHQTAQKDFSVAHRIAAAIRAEKEKA